MELNCMLSVKRRVLSVEFVVGCGKEWTSYLDVFEDREKWEEYQIEVGNWKGWICCCY
jgi:hypothetical protein